MNDNNVSLNEAIRPTIPPPNHQTKVINAAHENQRNTTVELLRKTVKLMSDPGGLFDKLA